MAKSKGITLEQAKDKYSPEMQSLIKEAEGLRTRNASLKRQAGDYNRLFSDLVDVIHTVDPMPYKPTQKKSRPDTDIVESLVLMVSDSHPDHILKQERVRFYEHYGFTPFCHRAERYMDSLFTYCSSLNNRRFDHIYFLLMGDHGSDGDIHGLSKHSEWKNCIKSSMASGEVYGMMIQDLAAKFPEQGITVVCVSGNHGRFGKKVNWKEPQTNWDYLSSMYAYTRCKEMVSAGKVDFVIPDAWSVSLGIHNWNFVVSHGHQIRGGNSLGIPHYGIRRNVGNMVALGAVKDITYNYFLLGHFHQPTGLPHNTGEVLINGSFLGTTEYLFEEKAAFLQPTQMAFGVSPEDGVTWRNYFNIRCKDWETKELEEPQRYKVNLFNETEVYDYELANQ